MFPEFFKNKMKEVGSFLKIMKGKATNDPKERAEGVDKALRAMDKEREVYLKEKEEAQRGVDSDTKMRSDSQDKVLRESGGQDISAI